MTMEKKKNIGTLLLEFGKISNADLEEGLKRQKEFGLRLGETLIKLGKVTLDDIEWILSKQFDIPLVMVDNFNLDHELISKFPRELLLKNRILPLFETEDEIAVATDDPLNTEVFETLKHISGKKIKLSSGNGEKIENILKRFQKKESDAPLADSLGNIIKKLHGTSFYRLDFHLYDHQCEINIFGSGILKKIATLDIIKKENIFHAFDSLNIPFLYDEYSSGEKKTFLSFYPITNRIGNFKLPAIIGMFGLLVPENVTFADIQVKGAPNIYSSSTPISGYPFICTKNTTMNFDKNIFMVDSSPENFNDFYVNILVPKKCRACMGRGCEKCNSLGFAAFEKIEGVFSSLELKQILKEQD